MEAQLRSYSEAISSRLDRYLEREVEICGEYHPLIKEVCHHAREYCMRGGMRLSSIAGLLVYKGYRGEIDDLALDVCVGLELYRHSILVHDDIVDESDERRGGAAFHHLFGDNRFGFGTAVFFGNCLFSKSLEAVVDREAARLLNQSFFEVNTSQILDLSFEYKLPDVEDWYTMAERRAPALFKTTMEIGGVTASAPEGDMELIRSAGMNFGFAFDIQDDLIDTFSNEAGYGRHPGGDITLGKNPLHMIYTREMASKSEIESIDALRGKKVISGTELEKVRQIIKECGAADRALERVNQHVGIGLTKVEETSMNREAIEMLGGMVEFVRDSLEWYR